MHEMALMKDLVRAIEQVAQNNAARRVTRVRLWVGALCHVTPHHLQAHFDEDVAGTLAAGAQLEVEQSTDIHDPRAQDVVLRDVELE
jgi:hydrogenase nickel incorporation protein HypA/HybF